MQPWIKIKSLGFFRNTLFLIFILIGIFACKPQPEQPASGHSDFEVSDYPETDEVRKIFYNLYLPTKMAAILEKTGTNYLPQILNDPENFARYQEVHEIAVNLGVYGVDLSYARIFDQKATTSRYLGAVQVLSEKLGIPSSYYEELFNELESYIRNPDSLATLATKIYEHTDNFLKENSGESTAALIVMGGWIEALYLASNILEQYPSNTELINRIAEQKYSLNSLISLLSNYQSDYHTAEYILMLKHLRESFDRFDIYYQEEHFSLDTINKYITASSYNSDLNPELAAEIGRKVSEIRTELVN